MGDYLKRNKKVVKQEIVQREVREVVDVDVNAIAEAVVKAIGDKQIVVGGNGKTNTQSSSKNEFDDKGSLAKLADAMTVQRGKSSSNFDDLGSTKETKKDVEDTIDLLKDIDD